MHNPGKSHRGIADAQDAVIGGECAQLGFVTALIAVSGGARALVLMFPLILAVAYVSGGISAKDLPQVTASLVTPLVGIAGTVLGFYFGSHRHDAGPQG